MKPEIVADTKLATGEGPLWHPMEEKLYWLDIPNGMILRYDPKTGSHEQVYQGEVIGGFTIQEDGALLLFMEKGAVIYSKGKIMGATGLMLGLAKERGLNGVCLLGATTGFKADRGAGFSVFKFLMKALGNEVKEGL